MEGRRRSFLDLPDDAILCVLAEVTDARSLLRLRLVSRRLRLLIDRHSDPLWRPMCARDFPLSRGVVLSNDNDRGSDNNNNSNGQFSACRWVDRYRTLAGDQGYLLSLLNLSPARGAGKGGPMGKSGGIVGWLTSSLARLTGGTSTTAQGHHHNQHHHQAARRPRFVPPTPVRESESGDPTNNNGNINHENINHNNNNNNRNIGGHHGGGGAREADANPPAVDALINNPGDRAHAGGMHAIAVWRDRVLTCGEDARVLVWPTGRERAGRHAQGLRVRGVCAVLEGHRAAVVSMAVWGDTLVTGSVDQSARVWHLPSRRCLSVLEGHTGSIWACAFTSPFRAGIDDPSAAPPTAVTGSYDGTLRVWRIGKPDPSIAHGPNGAHDDATVPSLSSTHELTGGHTDAVLSVAVVRATHVASAGKDMSLRVWHIADALCAHAVEAAHSAVITCIVHVEDGSELGRLVTSGLDGAVKAWNLSTCGAGHPRPRLAFVFGDRDPGSYQHVAGFPLHIEGTPPLASIRYANATGNAQTDPLEASTGSTDSETPLAPAPTGTPSSLASASSPPPLVRREGNEHRPREANFAVNWVSVVVPYPGPSGGRSTHGDDREQRLYRGTSPSRQHVSSDGRVYNPSPLLAAMTTHGIDLWRLGDGCKLGEHAVGLEHWAAAAIGGGVIAAGVADGDLVLWGLPKRRKHSGKLASCGWKI